MEAEKLRIDVNGVSIDLKTFTEEYDIRIGLTEDVPVEGLDRRYTRLMRVNSRDFNAYLFETPYNLRYISHPHIIGDSLVDLLRRDAPLIKGVIDKFSLGRFGKPVAVDLMAGGIDIGFPLLKDIKNPGNLVLIVPTPLEYDIEQIHEDARSKGDRVTVFLFLGSMSTVDIERLTDLSNSLGSDSIFLSNAFIGGKDCSGRIYAYGPDIKMLRSGKIVEIGSIIDVHTLSRLLREYPPSTDVSALKKRVSEEAPYLKSTLEDMMFLIEKAIFDAWQIEILLREAKSIKRQLMRDDRGKTTPSAHSR